VIEPHSQQPQGYSSGSSISRSLQRNGTTLKTAASVQRTSPAAPSQCLVALRHQIRSTFGRARILTRTVQGRIVRYCKGTNLRVPVPPERSLAVRYPQLAKELHPKRNGGLTAYDLLNHSKKEVWWQCQKNRKHAWQCSVDRRAMEESGCIHCYHEQWLDLRQYPQALKLFDHKKNKITKLYNLSTKTLFWWRCPKGPDHSWRSMFKKEGFRCPFCADRKLSVTNSLKTLFSQISKAASSNA